MLKYRFKLLLNDKTVFFWTLLFPMLLATFFNVTLKNAFEVSKVADINIAVLNDEHYQSDLAFQSFIINLDNVSVQLVDEANQGFSLVEAKEVSGYVELKESIHLFVESSQSESTTLSFIFDSYQSRTKMITEIISENPTTDINALLQATTGNQDHFSPNLERNSENVYVVYFYTTIAMLTVYAGHWGIRSARYLQASRSDVGKRTNIAPVSKLKLLLMDVFVVYVIYLIQFVILFSYLKYVLEIPFGHNSFLIIATALLGGLVNILIGYAASLIFNNSEAFITAFGVIASFLSGQQFVSMKYLVQRYVPLLASINPAALITDNFYVSYYYSDLSRAYNNLGIMLVMIITIGAFCIYRMKGVTYDRL